MNEQCVDVRINQAKMDVRCDCDENNANQHVYGERQKVDSLVKWDD